MRTQARIRSLSKATLLPELLLQFPGFCCIPKHHFEVLAALASWRSIRENFN
jgi:hypothetical protein